MNQPASLDLMIPPELLTPLSEAASERGVTMQAIILELVEEWSRQLEAARTATGSKPGSVCTH